MKTDQTEQVTLLRIIDGDTVEVQRRGGFLSTGAKERIRLYGIDAPESSQKGGDDDSQIGRPGGDRESECKRHDAKPPALTGPGRRGHGRFSEEAGIQIPVVRHRTRGGQQMVPIIKAVLRMRAQERFAHLVGPAMDLPRLQRNER